MELLAAWREGNTEAGGELYERYFPVVHRFFRFKVDEAVVVDLVQATFAAWVETRDRFRGESSYRAYVLAVARHKLLDHYRAGARRRDVAIEDVSLAALDPSPSSLLRRGYAQRRLLDAIRALPLDLQILVELRYWEELAGPELAEVLGVPEGTIRSRLRRAQEALREHIAGIGETLPGVELAQTDFDAWVRGVRRQLED